MILRGCGSLWEGGFQLPPSVLQLLDQSPELPSKQWEINPARAGFITSCWGACDTRCDLLRVVSQVPRAEFNLKQTRVSLGFEDQAFHFSCKLCSASSVFVLEFHSLLQRRSDPRLEVSVQQRSWRHGGLQRFPDPSPERLLVFPAWGLNRQDRETSAKSRDEHGCQV